MKKKIIGIFVTMLMIASGFGSLFGIIETGEANNILSSSEEWEISQPEGSAGWTMSAEELGVFGQSFVTPEQANKITEIKLWIHDNEVGHTIKFGIDNELDPYGEWLHSKEVYQVHINGWVSYSVDWTVSGNTLYYLFFTMVNVEAGDILSTRSSGDNKYDDGILYLYINYIQDPAQVNLDLRFEIRGTLGSTINNPPTAIIDDIDPSPAIQGQTVHFDGHGEDSDGTISDYSWSSNKQGHLSSEASFSTASLSVGTHIISFKVKDNDGVWSDEDTETLIIEPVYNQPPDIPGFLCGPNLVYTVDSCRFYTSTSDPEDDKVKYYFDWGGNSGSWTDLVDSSKFASSTHTWGNPGIYIVRVKAKDEHGLESGWSEGFTVYVENYDTSTDFRPLNYTGNMDYQYPYSNSVDHADSFFGIHSSSSNIEAGVIAGYCKIEDVIAGVGITQAAQQVNFYVGISKNLNVESEIHLFHKKIQTGAASAMISKYYAYDDSGNFSWEIIDPPWDWLQIIEWIIQLASTFIPGAGNMLTSALISALGSSIYDYAMYDMELIDLINQGEADLINVQFDMPINKGDHVVEIGILSTLMVGDMPIDKDLAETVFAGKVDKIKIDGIAKPSLPSINGPTSWKNGIDCTFDVNSNDPNNDNIRYRFDFGDNRGYTWTDWKSSGESVSVSHKYTQTGTYIVKVLVEDKDQMRTTENYHVIEIKDNQPPNEPTIDGETSCKLDTQYEYSFTAIDPEGDDIKFEIEWDDGDYTITDFVSSGTTVTKSHSWSNTDDFTIRSRAIDEDGDSSGWTTHPIRASRTKTYEKHLYLRFLEKHTILHLLLQRFLQK
jgi:hypothetical protein